MDSEWRVLVTGSAGLLGSHIIKLLNKEKVDYIAILSPKSLVKRPWITDYIDLRKALIIDLTDYVSVYRKISNLNFDTVIHCAGALSGTRAYSVNFYATKALLDAIFKSGRTIRRFIYISSILVLGDSLREDFNEESTCKPATLYEISKFLGERLVVEYADKIGYEYTIFRPTWIYGEYSINPDILLLVKAVKSHISPYLVPKDTLISMIYAGDLAKIIYHSISRDIVGIFNIGSQVMYKFSDLLNYIKLILNTWTIGINIPKAFLSIFTRFYEPARYLLLAPKKVRIDKWINEGGIIPGTPLLRGLNLTINWLIKSKLV